MTRITKVELSGFKSFRKQTVIPFFAGMTAIVGENGSGKSNLFDAVSFVMGRRSSELRADRFEHLIFNGGDRYPAAKSAEVILYLDNSEGEFNAFLENGHSIPEITIGRRITPKSSTYTFMERACSRAELEQLLEAAKIDSNGQQLIPQGRITEIVRRTPKRRREIIDEISGIAAYDEKRNKAIDELKDVKSKLNTHRVILAERRRRLVALQSERDAAIEYQQITAEQVQIQDSIVHKQREKIEAKLKQAQEERKGMDERIAELEKEVSRLDLAVENKEWELEGMQEDLSGDQQISLVKEVERIRSDILHKRSEVNFRRQQINNLDEMIAEITRMKAQETSQPTTEGGQRVNPAVQALLERKRGGIYGTIASLGAPKPGFEVAFETATGGSLNDLVVDTRETAIESINYLKEKRLGRARILPLRRLVTMRKSLASAEALKLPGVIDYAINLIEFDDKYRRAFEYVLGDTVIAENLEALKGVDGVRAVTLDGDLQSKGGAMSGGWRASAGDKSKGPDKRKESGFDVTQRRQQISKLRKEIDELEDDISELSTRLETEEKQLAERQESKVRVKGEALTRSGELHALRESRREAYQGLENLRRAITRYERQEAEAQAELDTIKPASKRDASEFIDAPLPELERRLKQNERRLHRLEPINMRAIDEYDTYEQEFNLFRERVDALEREKVDIERLIGEIEDRKRQRFTETLLAIDVEFRRIFQKLFEGGSASLELEIEGDISSGLMIRANPPDKEPHILDSLSGGEQTLVATAFIFALQEYQKAPFFILDEVDAALDMMNTTRLSRMLSDYAKRIQVIVVSHNEETVRHAERAYGVTMKNGVSEILALDLT
ncbi:MAG: chromosome segregation protein SMC [Candidatus Atribacteria bacterium]|nr:MAG: chromosome segregation protein SMC [Candidatus Atribacteria bacterium]